mgnify:CR=1 FL=1
MNETAVVDASIAGRWVLEDEKTDEALELLARCAQLTLTLVVPELWWYEMVNVLRTAAMRGRTSPEDAKRSLDVRRNLPLVVVSAEDQGVPAILSSALAHRLSGYDATYFNLAESRGLKLVTSDRHLLGLAHKFPWILTLNEFVRKLPRADQ